MAYKSFRVGPSKGLQDAEMSNVPDVLVIVGPNGAGKSTLLYELWRQRNSLAEPSTRVTYISPNRAWRRTTLTGPSMFGLQMSYRQVLEQESVPGFQFQAPPGYYQSGGARQADSMDEAQSLVKYSIARIEARRQRLISSVFDGSGGRVEPNSVPDVYGPLRELVHSLLPHLAFLRVDVTSENDQRCLFKKLDAVPPLSWTSTI